MLQMLASEVAPAVLIVEGEHLANGDMVPQPYPRNSFARPYFPQLPVPSTIMGSPLLRCGQPLNRGLS